MAAETIANTAFWRLRWGGNHTPSALAGERSKKGHAINAPSRIAGTRMPPNRPPLSVIGPRCTVVEDTSSCSHTKYHGALAGLGVTEGLAGPSSGALNSTASSRVRLKTTRNTRIMRRVRLGDDITWSRSSRPIELITATEVPGVSPNSE